VERAVSGVANSRLGDERSCSMLRERLNLMIDRKEQKMIENGETAVAEIGVRLVDDAYLSWFSAESECEKALHAWFEACAGQRKGAYLAYRAALDREEAAARDLGRLWQLAAPCREAVVHGEEPVC
jgi:hypothetical protein